MTNCSAPRVQRESCRVTGQSGDSNIHRVSRQFGFIDSISGDIHVIKRHLRYFESELWLKVAYGSRERGHPS
jgi:hypothetical protein